MTTNNKTASIDVRERISVLWIVVMFIMAFADIFTFMMPGLLNDLMTGNTPIKITQEFMLVMAILTAIPIVMIFLSRVLKYRINRWANIIASVITILYQPASVSGNAFL